MYTARSTKTSNLPAASSFQQELSCASRDLPPSGHLVRTRPQHEQDQDHPAGRGRGRVLLAPHRHPHRHPRLSSVARTMCRSCRRQDGQDGQDGRGPQIVRWLSLRDDRPPDLLIRRKARLGGVTAKNPGVGRCTVTILSRDGVLSEREKQSESLSGSALNYLLRTERKNPEQKYRLLCASNAIRGRGREGEKDIATSRTRLPPTLPPPPQVVNRR